MLKNDIQITDYQYIKGVRENHLPTLKKIYKECLPGIATLVKNNSGSADEARDVFQDALLVAYDKVRQPGFELTGTFYSFLYGISRFLWLRQLKKKHRNDITIEGEEGYMVGEDTEAMQVREEKWRLFREIFARLGADCQKVLGQFFDGKSLKEIGENLGYSTKYVKLKKFKCKEQFTEWIKKDKRYEELKN